MGAVSELMASLQCCFDWNKARLFCLSALLIALMGIPVTLREIAVALAGNTLPELRYRRLRRFFAYFKLDYAAIVRWIFKRYLNLTMSVFTLRNSVKTESLMPKNPHYSAFFCLYVETLIKQQ